MWPILAALALCACLSSCSLLPEEEALRTAPLLKTYERETFELAFAERADMTLSQRVSCTYVPVQVEALRFSVGGEYFDEIYASVGDNVVPGQLLAQLRLDGVQERIEACQAAVDRLTMLLTHLEEDRALALSACAIRGEGLGRDELAESVAAVNERYDADKRSLSDQLYVQNITLTELVKERAKRQLRPSIGGTVTYVRRVSDGELSVAGDRVITVADSTMSLFRAETDLWSRFSEGDSFEIVVGKASYEAVVAGEASLGLPAQEKIEGKKAYVYLTLKTPTFDLEDGDRGTLTLILDERLNALTVPEDAIAIANGQTIVYYQTEDGMKAYKPVTTGLKAQSRVEILEGLAEGEAVIVG